MKFRSGGWVACAVALVAACGDDLPEPVAAGPGVEPWAVGAGGAIWRRVDGMWRSVESPTERDLLSVWGASADDVWAVGAGGTTVHFDGATWTEVPSEVDVALRDVAGATSSDVWAVGDAGTVLRWDGAGWLPMGAPSTEDLLTVWVGGPRDVWIGGPTGALLNWNGDVWRTEQVSRPLVVRDLAGLTGDDLWAVGEESEACADCGTDECHDCLDDVVLHHDQSGWHERFIHIGGEHRYDAIAVLGRDDVWLAGRGCLGDPPVGEIVRWDGTRWFTERSGGEALVSIWGHGPEAMWAGGAEGAIARDEAEWRAEPGPRDLRAIWAPGEPDAGCDARCDAAAIAGSPPGLIESPCVGVECAGGLCDSLEPEVTCRCPDGEHVEESRCVADRACTGVTCSGHGVCVEDDGAPRCECEPGFLDHGGTACGAIVREGSCSVDGWCVVAPVPLARIAGLWSAGPDEVWAIGEDGDVARRRAGVWTRLDLGIDARILAIDGTGPDDVWLLTSEHLFHVDGESVIEVPVACRLGAHNPAALRPLSALAVASSGEVFVTGEQYIEGFPGMTSGTCRFDGDAWHPVEFDAEVTPWGVCGLESCDDVWAVGADQVWCGRDGVWDGDALHRVEGAPSAPTHDVWGRGPDDMWVASDTLWRWDGAAWSDSGITGVRSIDGTGPDDIWAAGEDVLHWDGVVWALIESDVGAEHVAAAGAGEASVASATELLRYTVDTRTDELTRLPMEPLTMWGASSDELWLGGFVQRVGGQSSVGGLARGDGETWTSVELPLITSVSELLGFAADEVWALAQSELDGAPAASYLLRYDGAWTLMPADDLDLGVTIDRRYLSVISGGGSSDLWIGGAETLVEGGDRGFVAHWDGATWTHTVATIPGAMWGLGEEVWIATGADLQRWDGASWQSFPQPDRTIIRAITGFATDDVWAAGSAGLLVRWDGTAWQSVASGTTADLVSLWGTGPDDLWASGGGTSGGLDGTVLHWDGATWSPEALPSSAFVGTVFGVDDDLWALSSYVLRK